MKLLLNIMSVVGTFLVVFGLLFAVQKFTLGQLSILKNIIVFKVVRFEDLVFAATSILVILKWFNFYIPDRTDLNIR